MLKTTPFLSYLFALFLTCLLSCAQAEESRISQQREEYRITIGFDGSLDGQALEEKVSEILKKYDVISYKAIIGESQNAEITKNKFPERAKRAHDQGEMIELPYIYVFIIRAATKTEATLLQEIQELPDIKFVRPDMEVKFNEAE